MSSHDLKIWFVSRPLVEDLAKCCLPLVTGNIDPDDLKAALDMRFPIHAPKRDVIRFIRKQHPFWVKDVGNKVDIRILGNVKDDFHSWDILIALEFDDLNRLLSYSIDSARYFV